MGVGRNPVSRYRVNTMPDWRKTAIVVALPMELTGRRKNRTRAAPIYKLTVALINLKNKSMGEIADDMIDGSSCSLCGKYFIKEIPLKDKRWDETRLDGYSHSFPVACKECWEPDCGFEKATADTI